MQQEIAADEEGVNGGGMSRASPEPCRPLTAAKEVPILTMFVCRRRHGEPAFELDFSWVFEYARDQFGSAFECQKILPPVPMTQSELPDPTVKMLVLAGFTPYSCSALDFFRIVTHSGYRHVVITTLFPPQAWINMCKTYAAQSEMRRLINGNTYSVTSEYAFTPMRLMRVLFAAQRKKGSGSGGANLAPNSPSITSSTSGP